MSWRGARRSLLLSPLLVLGVLAGAWGQTAPVPGLDKLTPEERALAERNLERWQKLTPEQRARALENYRRWKSMTPEEREAARENYQRLHKLSPESCRISSAGTSCPKNGGRASRRSTSVSSS